MRLVSSLLIISSSLFLTACGEISNQDNPKPNDFLQVDLINVTEPLPKAPPEETPNPEMPESTSDATKSQLQTTPKKSKVRAHTQQTNPLHGTMLPAPTAIIAEPPVAQATAPTPPPVLNNWQPNEAVLFRSSELINGLQRDIGRKPNAAEMQQRLQSHMGLNAAQAQQVITTLGLN